MGRTLQEFKPIHENFVGFYGCGPTVYNYAHIGNLRAYVFLDILDKTLTFLGYDIKHVMNITDVGHLTGDSDDGEDKMVKTAEEKHQTVLEIAQFYTDAFMKDIDALNIRHPDVICKATEHIDETIELIKQIEKNGHTYMAGGNLYFDISTFPDYGKLANLNLEELKEGAGKRKEVIIDSNKKNPGDFVLWFTKSKFESQAMTLLSAIQFVGKDSEIKSAFAIPATEDFMTKIHCHTLKAKSSDKTDIRIVLHDRRTRLNTEMGFSIKSQLGGDSTLLNAGKTTNFNFKICGNKLNDADIEYINTLNPKQKKVILRVQAIESKGCHLVFDKVDNPIFRNNLAMLDCCLGEIIGLLLLEQLEQDTNMLKDLVRTLSEKNPLNFDMSQSIPYYEYKVKNLLTSSALGMMPGKAWNGK